MQTYRITAQQHREPQQEISIVLEGKSGDDAYCKAVALDPDVFSSCEAARERLTTVKVERT